MNNRLAYNEAINLIIDYLLQSDKNWYALVYYKPMNAIMYISNANYMEIDEPEIHLREESKKLVEEFSNGSKKIIAFPSLNDEERVVVVEEFIAQLSPLKKEYYAIKWKCEREAIIENWRPHSIGRMFDVDDVILWQKYIQKKLEPIIVAFATSNNIDLYSLFYKVI